MDFKGISKKKFPYSLVLKILSSFSGSLSCFLNPEILIILYSPESSISDEISPVFPGTSNLTINLLFFLYIYFFTFKFKEEINY